MNTAKEIVESATVEKHNRALSIVVHDLKSPLNAIHGFSDFMRKGLLSTDPGHRHIEILERVIKAGKDMARLIDDITTMVKMEAGKERIDPEWVDDPGNELEEVLKTFEYEAQARGIDLRMEAPEFLPPIHWDITRIRNHVLNNLVSNALRVTPAGGSIVIAVEAGAESLRIRVKDTGPGIPAEDRQRIFSRFEQGDAKSNRAHKGAGLGLHNARLFVLHHLGRITLEDTEGKGASFLMEIPLNPFAA